jgi:hypothetical protein
VIRARRAAAFVAAPARWCVERMAKGATRHFRKGG